MFLDLIEIWNDTIDELGGWKGFLVLTAGMFAFVQIVHWTVGRRRVRKTVERMNYERQRKAKGL